MNMALDNSNTCIINVQEARTRGIYTRKRECLLHNLNMMHSHRCISINLDSESR